MEFNYISASLQWHSVNGTFGLKQVTTFNILMPGMFRDQIWNQGVKIVPGANFHLSGLNNKEVPYLGIIHLLSEKKSRKTSIMAAADKQADHKNFVKIASFYYWNWDN